MCIRDSAKGDLDGAAAHYREALSFAPDNVPLLLNLAMIAVSYTHLHSSSLQRPAVHNDRVELNLPIAIQMRPDSRVKCRIVFENHNRRFDRIERRAALRQNRPARLERAPATITAILNRNVGDIPRAAVNDKRRFQVRALDSARVSAF